MVNIIHYQPICTPCTKTVHVALNEGRTIASQHTELSQQREGGIIARAFLPSLCMGESRSSASGLPPASSPSFQSTSSLSSSPPSLTDAPIEMTSTVSPTVPSIAVLEVGFRAQVNRVDVCGFSPAGAVALGCAQGHLNNRKGFPHLG